MAFQITQDIKRVQQSWGNRWKPKQPPRWVKEKPAEEDAVQQKKTKRAAP